jgi:hypothetical protein
VKEDSEATKEEVVLSATEKDSRDGRTEEVTLSEMLSPRVGCCGVLSISLLSLQLLATPGLPIMLSEFFFFRSMAAFFFFFTTLAACDNLLVSRSFCFLIFFFF